MELKHILGRTWAAEGATALLPVYFLTDRDIGLIDTMKDLLVNFVGAVVFSVAGYFYARSKGKKRAAALNFVPSKKNEDHDYLQQARENGPDLPEKRKK